MRLKAFTAIAALLFMTACATAPEESGEASGTGGAAASTGSQPTQTAKVDSGSSQTKAMRADKPAPGSYADLVANVGDRVFFGFDKYELQSQARAMLDRQAAWMKQYPRVTVKIEGHCDERGTREYNLALGQRRASAVRDYLVASGVSGSRIDTISYGKERPEVAGSNEAAWTQNRRGVTTIN